MAEGDGGSIIQMGSLNNAIGLAGVTVYGAHKAGLCQLAKSMSVEWAEHKIRVNAICPGHMLTPLTVSLWNDPVRSAWLLERSLWKQTRIPRGSGRVLPPAGVECRLLHHRPGDLHRGRMARRDALGQDRLRAKPKASQEQFIETEEAHGKARIGAETRGQGSEPQGVHSQRSHRRRESRPPRGLLLERGDRRYAVLSQDETRS